MRPGSGRAHHAQRSLSRHGDRLPEGPNRDRKSTRLNSSHLVISYAVFCLKKKKTFRPTSTRPTLPFFMLPAADSMQNIVFISRERLRIRPETYLLCRTLRSL